MFDTKVLKPHISLNVSDVEASIDFYRRMFGIEPAKVRTGYAKFDVETPALNLTLNQVPFVPKGGLSHLGVQVAATEDVLAIRDRWVADGLVPREEMQTTCCYAVQDKAWVRDPDGNEWEAFVVLEDNLPEGIAKSDDAACCVPTFTKIDGSSKEPAIACC